MATAEMERASGSSNRKLSYAGLAAFFPTGILTTILGPMLPLLILRWQLNDTQAGNLFLVQFFSQLVGTQLAGVLMARRGYRLPFLAALLLMSAGAGSLLAGSVALGMAAVSLYGLGVGMMIPTDSLLIAEITPDSRASAMNLLNFFWGAGAVTCSLMIAWAAAHGKVAVFLGAVSVILVLLFLASVGLTFPGASRAEAGGARWQELLRNPAIWLFSAVFLLYPGSETAVGGWVGSYVSRLGPQGMRWAAVMPAFFWSALTAGRGLGSLIVSDAFERRILRAGFAAAAAGIVLLLVSPALPGVVLGALVTGLSYSTLYPITIARLSHHFGVEARRIGAFMFSMASVGPALIPWMVGITSQATGSLRAGLLLPLGATVILLLIHLRDW
jgi:MFS transporter, FHS family, glucose/mannose:H+ symporter